MAKKRITKNFTENLAIYTKDLLTDVQKVRIAKNTYILNNYEELIKAIIWDTHIES